MLTPQLKGRKPKLGQIFFMLKLYDNQSNAQVFFKNLFPYLLLPYMFRSRMELSTNLARTLTPYKGD
jgi:hypothetical protein